MTFGASFMAVFSVLSALLVSVSGSSPSGGGDKAALIQKDYEARVAVDLPAPPG